MKIKKIHVKIKSACNIESVVSRPLPSSKVSLASVNYPSRTSSVKTRFSVEPVLQVDYSSIGIQLLTYTEPGISNPKEEWPGIPICRQRWSADTFWLPTQEQPVRNERCSAKEKSYTYGLWKMMGDDHDDAAVEVHDIHR